MTLIRWADAAYLGIIHILAFISVALLALVTGWICLEVVSRIIGAGILSGSVEFTEYAIFNMAFLAAPWILHHNGHVRVQVVIEQLSGQTRKLAEASVNLLAALICLVLTYYATLNLITAVERNEQIFGELVFPEWYLQWQVPLSFGLLAIGFLKFSFGEGPHALAPTEIKE